MLLALVARSQLAAARSIVHGLTGLYVIPTARTLGKGGLGIGYNESKHVEWIGSTRFSDRQVRATVTYGVTDTIEVYGGYRPRPGRYRRQLRAAGWQPELQPVRFQVAVSEARPIRARRLRLRCRDVV